MSSECKEDFVEPQPQKKLKLSRGRPKIHTPSIVSSHKKYFERQAQFVQVKFNCIHRDKPPMTSQEAAFAVQLLLGDQAAHIFIAIQQEKHNFLEAYEDPADPNFVDQCDYTYLITKLAEKPDELRFLTLLLIYGQSLSEDMDREAFDQICKIFGDLINHFSKNSVVQIDEVKSFPCDDAEKRKFLESLGLLMQETLAICPMRLINS